MTRITSGKKECQADGDAAAVAVEGRSLLGVAGEALHGEDGVTEVAAGIARCHLGLGLVPRALFRPIELMKRK